MAYHNLGTFSINSQQKYKQFEANTYSCVQEKGNRDNYVILICAVMEYFGIYG